MLLMVVAVGLGMIAWFLTMVALGLFWGFLLGAPVFVVVVFAVAVCGALLTAPQQAQNARRAAEEIKHRNERRSEITKERDAWFDNQPGWIAKSTGRILNLEHLPKCFMAIEPNGLLVRIVEFDDQEEFRILRDRTFAISQVISLNVASPTIEKKVYTTQHVPVVSKEKRSPVARGLIGGILLGPVGAIAGAASGLNGKVTTKVEEYKVEGTVERLGDPQLIMGLNDLERPILKIRFDPPSLADEWNFRIRAAQARR